MDGEGLPLGHRRRACIVDKGVHQAPRQLASGLKLDLGPAPLQLAQVPRLPKIAGGGVEVVAGPLEHLLLALTEVDVHGVQVADRLADEGSQLLQLTPGCGEAGRLLDALSISRHLRELNGRALQEIHRTGIEARHIEVDVTGALGLLDRGRCLELQDGLQALQLLSEVGPDVHLCF